MVTNKVYCRVIVDGSSFKYLKLNVSSNVAERQVSVFDCESESQLGGEDFNAALLNCLLKGSTFRDTDLSEADAFWRRLQYTMLWNRGT